MEIVLNVFMSLISLAWIGLMVTNPRLISKVYYGLSDGLNSWFEKAFSRTVERFEDQGALEPATGYDVGPEPIDYKKLERDNLQSMRDSWDERFLKLHKLEDLTDDQLDKMETYPDVDREALLEEVKKRLRKRRAKMMKNMSPEELEFMRSISHDPDQMGMLSNKCARNKHISCKDVMCDCDCHVE